MTRTEMTVGVFARRTGLTPSALRFYDDAGVLPPARIDVGSGYRYYRPDQVRTATLVRRLREIGLPLAAVTTIITTEPGEAAQLIDGHVARLVADAAAAQRSAGELRAELEASTGVPVCTSAGPVLADAVEQVLTATGDDPAHPVLAGVRLEAQHGSLTLTATDRYRLTTRTLVAPAPTDASWSGTLAADGLRGLAARFRRSATVEIQGTDHAAGFRLTDGWYECPLLVGDFPDYRLLLATLPDVTHRVTTGRRSLMDAIEKIPSERLGLLIRDAQVRLLSSEGAAVPLAGTARGGELEVWFELTTLYPALGRAIGADVMLDLRGCDGPATIRSADSGDLTSLAMPVAHDRSTTSQTSTQENR